MSADLKGVTIGAGYFSQFHYEAWSRIKDVNICAACDLAQDRLRPLQKQFGIERIYSDYHAMFDDVKPDFVDIITPPQTHEAICSAAAERGLSILCQKPLAPTLTQSEKIAAHAKEHNVSFMVHENFRFQPWYREIKMLLERGAIGETLHSITGQTRLGDGWGPDAYLGRQPYFREMERLLVFETGIHFIDTFRFLAGDMTQVYARLRQLNSVIKR